MYLRQVQYLVALEQEGHFGRAAEKCHVSQPSLSSSLKSLEEELGFPIILRQQKFQGFTQEGHVVINWAKRLLADRSAMLDELAVMRDNLNGQLRIGASPMSSPLFPAVSQMVQRRYPFVQLDIQFMGLDQLVLMLGNFELDVGFTDLDDPQLEKFITLPLYEEPLYLLLPENEGQPLELDRGSTLVDAELTSDEERAAELADGIGRWMLHNLAADGGLPYKYWSSRGTESPADNAIRRFLASSSLARLGELRASAGHLEAARRNLRYNLDRYFRDIYERVLVNRYDQTADTGASSRVGPAFHDTRNPDFLSDVGWGRDDHALIVDGETRDLGGGVSATVRANPDGSYDVTLAGGRHAEFEPWCAKIWFTADEYARLGEYAAPHGVSLAIEPHVGAALSRPDQAVWLIEQIGRPNVGLNLDYSHFQAIGMSVAEAVPPLAPHALHTHIKGVKGRWPEHAFLTPGEDDFDHATYLGTMHDCGYRGYETVEISKMVVARPDYEPFAHAQLAYDTLADAARRAGIG